MSRCLKCKAANPTIHITSLAKGGEVLSMDFCLGCAPDQKKSFDIAVPAHKITCPRCGTSLAEAEEMGRLGCPEDYKIFAKTLAAVLEEYHGSAQHVGKTPKIEEEEMF